MRACVRVCVCVCVRACVRACVSRRTSMKMLHVLEQEGRQTGGGGGGEVQVVKEYVRAGAGHEPPHPRDLRPAHVLIETMLYLIKCVSAPDLQQLVMTRSCRSSLGPPCMNERVALCSYSLLFKDKAHQMKGKY